MAVPPRERCAPGRRRRVLAVALQAHGEKARVADLEAHGLTPSPVWW
jgi:hypothetical protein